MKKRLLTALTALCLLFGCVVFGASCSLDVTIETVREEVSKTFTTAATTEVYIISETDSDEPSVTDEPESSHGSESQEPTTEACLHQAEPTPAVPPTCALEGSENGTHCALCGETLTVPEVVQPLRHSFNPNGICLFCGMPDGNGVEGLEYLDLYNQSYGYEYLGTMGKGDALQAFYRLIDEQARKYHTDPSLSATKMKLEQDFDPLISKVDYASLGLTMEDAQAVWKTYRDDNPLYYWLSNQVGCTSKTLYLLSDPDYAEGAVRIETNKALYLQISGYLSQIPSEATEYRIALIMHDVMIDSIDYAWASPNVPEKASWAHNILGVFDGRGAVCEGFARAYQLLLNFKGVDCLFVTGESRGQGHAWNMIELDGEWYGIDVTWDDGGEESSPYAYFCLSEAEFYQSHVKDLPTAEGIDFLYGVPELAAYSIQWVDLYLGDALVGRYRCIDLAFAAMTDLTGDYTVRLQDGADDDLLHDTEQYRIYGDVPAVGSLMLIGTHQILNVDWFGNESYTASVVYLMQDWELKCDVTLKSLFLRSDNEVVINRGTYSLSYGGGNYSAVKANVSVFPR